MKRKVCFHEDVDRNLGTSNESHSDGEQANVAHPQWYSALELQVIHKNAVLAMDGFQNKELSNLLHRSYREYRSSIGTANHVRDSFDEKTAQTILQIWSSAIHSSSKEEDLRGMENMINSRLSMIRRNHRKRVKIGVLLAQKRYKTQSSQADLQERIARVSCLCSASSRRFAEMVGKADALAAKSINFEGCLEKDEDHNKLAFPGSEKTLMGRSPSASILHQPLNGRNQAPNKKEALISMTV